jgi:NADH:ubiquinone oxidoreductase subunit C
MLPEALAELTREAGGEALLLDSKHSRAIVSDLSRLTDICRNLRHHGFTRFVDFAGEHLGADSFAFRLALRNPAHGHALLMLKWKCKSTPASPTHPTLSKVWPGAGVAEREAFEMLGVPFAGHENLKPLLLEEQFAGNPLRKDYMPAGQAAGISESGESADGGESFAARLLRERHEAGMVAALHNVGQGPRAEGQGNAYTAADDKPGPVGQASGLPSDRSTGGTPAPPHVLAPPNSPAPPEAAP